MSTEALVALADRVGPVLVFLVAITVVAEIADRAGVFDVAAHWCAQLARQRTWLLWLLVALLASLSTIVLSLDTTAVLLTPVVITVARQVRVSPVPFVLTTLWLANTASLLLPVSNLTNLLSLHRFRALGAGYSAYLSLLAGPALAAILATVVVLLLWHGRQLRGGYPTMPRPEPHDRVLLVVAGATCAVLGPVFATGVIPAVPASLAAVLLIATCALRAPQHLRALQVPWAVVFGVAALFVVVDLAGQHGLSAAVAAAAGHGTGVGDLLRLAAVAAAASNVVNNLPAYLAIEPVADGDPVRLAALLIGTNCGPLVTAWGSLATILWRQRCRSAGMRIGLGRLAVQGLTCAVATVVVSVLVLAWLNPS
ncbi:MAG TPA: SLC13 family permease [Segeticoccus sp.]|nr:SLC13 family permease [Segeticoccus sp.]